MGNHSPWLVLGIAVLVQSVGGLFYAFSLYTHTLKDRFGYSQGDVDTIGSLGNVGGSVGIHIGFFFAAFGPRKTLVAATALSLLGWLPLWAALSPALTPDTGAVPYWSLCLLAVLQGQAQNTGDLAAVATVVANFPEHRGRAVGLAKAMVGLSGAMASSVYVAFFKPDVVSLILFIAIEASAILLVGSLVLALPPPPASCTVARGPEVGGRLVTAAAMVVTMALLLVVSALQKPLGISRAGEVGLCCAVYGLFAATIGYLACGCGGRTRAPPLLPPLPAAEPAATTSGTLDHMRQSDAAPAEPLLLLTDARATLAANVRFRDALRMPEAWIQFVLMWIGCGSGAPTAASKPGTLA